MKLALRAMRMAWAASDAKRDRGLRTPLDVQREDNIAYGPDGDWNLLDVYLPRDAPGLPPTFVNVHGGGYFYGSKDGYQYYGMGLAQRGVGVVNINYHLFPDYCYPRPLHDIDLALAWLVREGTAHGLGIDRVYMVGDSAGAQLVSQYAAAWADRAYASELGLNPPQVRLCGLGLNCGMYEIRDCAKNRDTGKPNDLIGGYFSGSSAGLDVLDHIDPTYPPAYLMSAPGDFLLSCCEPMAELLRSRGVDAAYKIYGDEKTGHVFHLDMRSELARDANDDEVAWLLAHE